MLRKLAYKAGGIFRFFRKRYKSYEHIFQLIGGFLGFAIAILLLVGGIAAVPFTGGGSLIPTWVGWLIFVGTVTTTTLAFGRFFGITLDAMFNEHKSNNEKLATAVAFVFAMAFAALIAPLAYVIAPFINTNAYQSLWGIVPLFFVSTVQTITSIGRHIGRTVDKHFDQKTVPDRIWKLYRFVKEKIFGIPHDKSTKLYKYIKFGINYNKPKKIKNKNLDMSAVVRDPINNATAGILKYLKLPRDGENTHLGFFSRIFDHKAGTRRANTYLTLLRGIEFKEVKMKEREANLSALRGDNQVREVNLNLKKAAILFTMLGGGEGEKLKTMVSHEMGFGGHEDPVEAATKTLEKYIRQQLPRKEDREYLQKHVITRLGLYGDNGKRLYKARTDKQIEEVKGLNKDNTLLHVKKMREEYSEIWDHLNNARFKN